MENLSDTTNQDLDIRNSEIPDDTFERLMKEVTQNYGIPLSYMRVHQANLLEMLIPPRSKRGRFFFLIRIVDNIFPLLQKCQISSNGTCHLTFETKKIPRFTAIPMTRSPKVVSVRW